LYKVCTNVVQQTLLILEYETLFCFKLAIPLTPLSMLLTGRQLILITYIITCLNIYLMLYFFFLAGTGVWYSSDSCMVIW